MGSLGVRRWSRAVGLLLAVPTLASATPPTQPEKACADFVILRHSATRTGELRVCRSGEAQYSEIAGDRLLDLRKGRISSTRAAALIDALATTKEAEGGTQRNTDAPTRAVATAPLDPETWSLHVEHHGDRRDFAIAPNTLGDDDDLARAVEQLNDVRNELSSRGTGHYVVAEALGPKDRRVLDLNSIPVNSDDELLHLASIQESVRQGGTVVRVDEADVPIINAAAVPSGPFHGRIFVRIENTVFDVRVLQRVAVDE